MHPPKATCRALHSIRPDLRLCWVDHPWRDTDLKSVAEPEGPECHGTFGIVQLLPKRLVGTPENPKTTIPPLWEHVYGAGSLFNKNGVATPDWNTTSLQPVLIAETVPEFGHHPRDVFSGRLIWRLQFAIMEGKAFQEHRKQVALEKGRALESHQQGVSGENADYWKWLANRTGESGEVMDKDEIKRRVPKWFRDCMDGALSYNEHFVNAWGLR